MGSKKISLAPLNVEDALRKVMEVNPEEIKKKEPKKKTPKKKK